MTAPGGETDEAAAYRALLETISAAGVFACPGYKDGCLRRRIAVRMRASSMPTYAAYLAHLQDTPAEWPRLLDALTINVTNFFRNADVFAALAERVLPTLGGSGAGPIRVWSAACATGEEPWSLAMLMHAEAQRRGDPRLLDRFRVTATDIDERALAAAERGVYTAAAAREMPSAMRETYLVGEPPQVHEALRPLVRFRRHDLLLEAPLPGPFHLIVCRNVLIYFERPAQDVVLTRFHEVLAPDGLLVLGKSETLLGLLRDRFAPVSSSARLYRRLP
jgi:chemotaxis methyl-accepting protein methylase